MSVLYRARPAPYLPGWQNAPVPGWAANPRVSGPPFLGIGQMGSTMAPRHYSLYWRAHPLAEWQFQHYFLLTLADYQLVRDRYRQMNKPFYFASYPQWSFYDHTSREYLY